MDPTNEPWKCTKSISSQYIHKGGGIINKNRKLINGREFNRKQFPIAISSLSPFLSLYVANSCNHNLPLSGLQSPFLVIINTTQFKLTLIRRRHYLAAAQQQQNEKRNGSNLFISDGNKCHNYCCLCGPIILWISHIRKRVFYPFHCFRLKQSSIISTIALKRFGSVPVAVVQWALGQRVSEHWNTRIIWLNGRSRKHRVRVKYRISFSLSPLERALMASLNSHSNAFCLPCECPFPSSNHKRVVKSLLRPTRANLEMCVSASRRGTPTLNHLAQRTTVLFFFLFLDGILWCISQHSEGLAMNPFYGGTRMHSEMNEPMIPFIETTSTQNHTHLTLCLLIGATVRAIVQWVL